MIFDFWRTKKLIDGSFVKLTSAIFKHMLINGDDKPGVLAVILLRLNMTELLYPCWTGIQFAVIFFRLNMAELFYPCMA